MFKIVTHRKVWWPVSFDVALDNGRTQVAKFDMRFIILGVDDAKGIERDAAAIDSADEGRPLSQQKAEMLLKIADDWKDVADEDGTKLDFSVESLAKLANVSGMFEAVIAAYAGCLRGRVENRRKN